MTKSGNRSLKGKVRRSYFISTVSITLVLFLAGSVGYLIINASRASERMRENMALYIMLSDSVDMVQRDTIGARLTADEAVKEIRYRTKDDAAAEFRNQIGDDFEEFLDYNPLPASYEIHLRSSFSNQQTIDRIEKEACSWQGVDEVVYQRNIAEQVTRNLGRFNLIILIFGGALLVISFILIGNTIRISIFSKRYLINTMKLVGASKWFIVRPFLVDSIYQGLIAGVAATLLFVAMIGGLNRSLPDVMVLAGDHPIVIIAVGMVVGGVIISALYTLVAVNKFIKMNSSKIHLY